jgi:hypothetical protein
MDLDVTFKKENDAYRIVNIVAADVGQGFPPVKSPTSVHAPTTGRDRAKV